MRRLPTRADHPAVRRVISSSSRRTAASASGLLTKVMLTSDGVPPGAYRQILVPRGSQRPEWLPAA